MRPGGGIWTGRQLSSPLYLYEYAQLLAVVVDSLLEAPVVHQRLGHAQLCALEPGGGRREGKGGEGLETNVCEEAGHPALAMALALAWN
jgi:hypothetical protein